MLGKIYTFIIESSKKQAFKSTLGVDSLKDWWS